MEAPTAGTDPIENRMDFRKRGDRWPPSPKRVRVSNATTELRRLHIPVGKAPVIPKDRGRCMTDLVFEVAGNSKHELFAGVTIVIHDGILIMRHGVGRQH